MKRKIGLGDKKGQKSNEAESQGGCIQPPHALGQVGCRNAAWACVQTPLRRPLMNPPPPGKGLLSSASCARTLSSCSEPGLAT